MQPASIRYNNPGAMYPGPSALAYGSDTTGTIGGGHLIAGFPDPISGAAAQFDLLRRRYANMPLSDAITKWSGGNNPGLYVNSIAGSAGIPGNTVLSPDLLSDPQFAIPLAKAMARHEAGMDFPLSDEQWQKAHAMVYPDTRAVQGSPAGLWYLPDAATPDATGSPSGLPEDASMPENAQPTSGILAPRQSGILGGEPEPSFLDRVGNFLSNNSATLMALGGGIARKGVGGFAEAAPYAVAERRQQTEQASQMAAYNFVKRMGGTEDQAQAAALNPHILQSMLPQIKTVQDMLGNQRLVNVSPITLGTAQAGGGAGGTSVAGAGADYAHLAQIPQNYNAQGKDEGFLAAIEQQDKVLAKAIVDITEGRLPAQGRNLQKLIPLAARYDHTFTGMQDYQSRLQTAKSFASGRDAETVKSYNQALIHAEKVWDLIPRIEGVNVGGVGGKLLNVPYGEYRAATDAQFAADRKQYENIVQALSGELMKASRGTGVGSLEEIRSWKAGALAANSGAEMRGAMRGAIDFLDGALQASAEKKANGMKSQFDPSSFLTPKAKGIFDKIQSSSEGGSEASPAPAQKPQPAQQQPTQTAPALPPQAAQRLREGVVTTFQNGQKWTLKNGQPVQVP